MRGSYWPLYCGSRKLFVAKDGMHVCMYICMSLSRFDAKLFMAVKD